MPPEAQARTQIDQLLQAAGWLLCDVDQVNLHAAQGVAIREFPLRAGHGVADYLLYVNGKACGVIEAKKAGVPLKGVEVQSSRYAQGLPATLPAWRRPLPFVFESTGVETQFTNGLDPQPRSRRVFAFFWPELLALWLQYQPAVTGPQAANRPPSTLLARMNGLPPLITQWDQVGSSYQLWSAQTTAVQNLEASLAANTVCPDTDNHRQRQNLYRHHLYLPAHQIWRHSACAVSGGPCQPGAANQKGI